MNENKQRISEKINISKIYSSFRINDPLHLLFLSHMDFLFVYICSLDEISTQEVDLFRFDVFS